MKFYSHYFLAAWLIGLPTAAPAAPAATTKPAQPIIIQGFAGNYLSGEFARDNGDIPTAIRYLQDAHADNPESARITKELQGLLLLQGEVDEAAALAASGSDDSTFSGLLMALQNIKNNQLDKADEVLDKIADDNHPQLWQPLLSAWVELGQKKPAKPFSLEDFDADIGSASALVDYHLALLNDAAGFTTAAAQNFHDAISDPKRAPERVMRRLIGFYQHHDKPAILASIVKTYLDTHPAFNAKETLPPVVTAQDGGAEVLFTLGSIMLGSGETTDAAIYLQLAHYLKPHENDTLLALGDAYGGLSRYADADAAYAKIPASSPLYTKAQLHIAVNEDGMGHLDDALSRLAALEKHPASASDALVTTGDLLRLHKRYAEAAAAYGKGLSLLPSPLKEGYWPVLFARGACLEREGKWEQAKQELKEALKIKPGQPDVLNYLGYGMIEHGEALPLARAMIEQAVKERPDDPQILDSMGWALYLSGDYAKAALYAERAVDLLPDDATVNDHLGDVYWRTGRKIEARYQWKRSLNFLPEAGLASSIEKKLKSGLPPVAQTGGAAPRVAARMGDTATQ